MPKLKDYIEFRKMSIGTLYYDVYYICFMGEFLGSAIKLKDSLVLVTNYKLKYLQLNDDDLHEMFLDHLKKKQHEPQA